MKHIETPAWKLTADCIRSSFRSSGKRHLLLIGSKQSGKSTLLSLLTNNALPGITTRTITGDSVYLLENSTGHEALIGVRDILREGANCRMHPIFSGFMALGLPAMERCIRCGSPWISMDQIGYLELACPEYCDLLLRLMDRKRLIATVWKQEHPFLTRLLARDDVFAVDLDHPFGDFGCVIMASGLATRFGRNKLMTPFLGEPMIRRVLNATDGIFARRVVVTRHRSVADYCRDLGVEVILHDLPNRSDTVRLGLERCADLPGCMFCQADQPLLRADTVKSLTLCAAAEPDMIWRAAAEATPVSPILFPRWAYPELMELPEGKGGGVVAEKYPQKVRLLSVRNPDELEDADTVEDLYRLQSKSSRV